MRTFIAISVYVVSLIAGFCLYCFNFGGHEVPYYEASDKLLLSQNEWEQFKLAVVDDDYATLKYANVINHGQSVLVEYKFNVESEYFPFGNVIEKQHYEKSPQKVIMSILLLMFGAAICSIIISGNSTKDGKRETP